MLFLDKFDKNLSRFSRICILTKNVRYDMLKHDKKEVERLLGFAMSIGERHYYFGSELAISYDKHETGHSYQFMNLSIGIYREMTPRDVEEMIAEMKAHGIPTEQNPNLEAEKEKALHFATVGSGACGYYQR